MTSLLSDTARAAAALGALLLVVARCTPFEASDPRVVLDAGGAPSGPTDPIDENPAADAGRPVDAGAARSCAELRARGESESGIYSIAATGDAAAMDIFCEMAIDNGGWTLVGRSASSETARDGFGWRSSRGTVTGDGAYSLDARKLPSPLTEVLIRAGSDATGPIYKKTLPADFLASHLNKATDSSTKTIRPGCNQLNGTNGPFMLSSVGFTGKDNHFRFRDKLIDDGDYGLLPNGWNANNGNCEGTGGLDKLQARIFVR